MAPVQPADTIRVGKNTMRWFDGLLSTKAAMSGGDASATEFTLEEVTKYNDMLLLGFGPNKDSQHKLRQVERHMRMHELYESGQLTKCTFSYYLYHTRDIPHQMWLRLTGQVDNATDPLNVPTRLAKLPPGYSVLADRGFAHDAPKYPFLNPHITPHFLARRKQFTKGEIEIDRGVCTLRYTSEVVFSHVFDENTLKDAVPSGLFSILGDSWDWGHAAANFNQPLRPPADWEQYMK